MKQATITNEVELERARVASMGLSERPPPSLLSFADAYASSTPSTAWEVSGTSSAKLQAAPVASEVDPEQEMEDRLSLGDFSGALIFAESILVHNPAHHGAKETASTCKTTLQKMYLARIGPLDRVPTVAVPREQLRWLSIDHRAGFVLSLIDGSSSLEMVMDLSGMPTLDVLRILHELAQQQVIRFA